MRVALVELRLQHGGGRMRAAYSDIRFRRGLSRVSTVTRSWSTSAGVYDPIDILTDATTGFALVDICMLRVDIRRCEGALLRSGPSLGT